MGLVVRSLEDLPSTSDRQYYIYLLDYGWHEPLADALIKNFDRIATSVSSHKGVVIRPSFDGIHFADEVLSWHSINGEDVENGKLLPAILLTNRHPREFRYFRAETTSDWEKHNFKIVLIPLKKFCKTTTDVVNALISIADDVKVGKNLEKFSVAKEMKSGIGKAIVDGVILEPNIGGIGFSLNKMFDSLRKK
jgi:hypothetical protein